MIKSAKRKIIFGIAATVSLLIVLGVALSRASAGIIGSRLFAQDGCSCVMDTLMTIRDWAVLGFTGLFSVGVLVGIAYAVVALVRTKKLLKNISIYDKENRLFLFNGDHCESFTFGFLRPKIALCTHCVRNLSKNEINAILQHEYHHVARRHPLEFFILDIVKYAFFFAPFLRNLISEYRTIAEIEADEQVTSRQALGGVLLQMINRQGVATVASFASRLSLRIERLIKPSWKINFQIDVLGLFLTLAVLTGTAFMVFTKPSLSPMKACPMHPRQQCIKPMLDTAPTTYYNL